MDLSDMGAQDEKSRESVDQEAGIHAQKLPSGESVLEVVSKILASVPICCDTIKHQVAVIRDLKLGLDYIPQGTVKTLAGKLGALKGLKVETSSGSDLLKEVRKWPSVNPFPSQIPAPDELVRHSDPPKQVDNGLVIETTAGSNDPPETRNFIDPPKQ